MVSLRSIMGANRSAPCTVKQNPHELISETLLSELEFQINETEERKKESQKRKNEELGRPDYSWLMNAPKSYRIRSVTRMEIEETSKLIHLDSVSTIISEFRELISKEIPADKLASYLKFVLHQHVSDNGKPQGDKYVNYKPLKGLRNEDNVRSNSAATLQHRPTDRSSRPLSAPLTCNKKINKRSRVYPDTDSCKLSDSCFVELEDFDGNENDVIYAMSNQNTYNGEDYGTTFV